MVERVIILTACVALVLSGCDERKSIPSAVGPGDGAGASKQSENYQVFPRKVRMKAGETKTVEVKIRPKAPYKINEEYDYWQVAFGSPGQQLALARQSFGKEDLRISAKEAIVPLEIQARQGGDYSLKARADISICDPRACLVLDQESFALAVEIEPGEASAASKPADAARVGQGPEVGGEPGGPDEPKTEAKE